MAASKALNNVFKLNDIVSVKEPRFGAAGDGATDDTAAFALAVTFCVANNKALFIPSSTYKASISLAATDDYLTIMGEDWENTIIDAKDNSTTTIAIASGCHNVTIENLSVKNTGGTNNGTHYGIRSLGDGAGNGASYLHLRKVKVDGYNINVKLDEFNGHVLESVWSTGAVHGGAAAPSGANIYAGHTTNHCVGLWMTDVHTQNGKYGYYMETAEGAAFTNCESILATTRGFLHTTAGTAVTGMQMTNCQFDSAGAGAMGLYKVNNGQFTNVWVSSGNTAAGAGAYGLNLEECDHNTFAALQAYGCTTDGVQLAAGSQKNIFIGLQSISNGGDGVQADDTAWGNTFTSPTVWNNTGLGFRFSDDEASEPNVVLAPYDRGNGGTSLFNAKDVVFGGTEQTNRIKGALLIEATQTSGVSVGDLVIGNDKGLRSVTAAGTGTVRILKVDAANILQLGESQNIPVAVPYTAAASLDAGGAYLNGRVEVDSTNNRLIYYSGANRYYIAGTLF